MKVAVTVSAEFMVTVHVSVPDEQPVHAENVDPAAGVAVSVTIVPLLKGAIQVAPQLMDPSLLVTVPVPVPSLVTDRLKVPFWIRLKVATTVSAEFMVTVHVAVPDEQPIHPANVDPDAGDAVSVTIVPLLKGAIQVAPQLMDPSLLVTVPLPVPSLEIDKLKVWICWVKVADTFCAEFMVTVHVCVTDEQPLHPANVDPVAGVAVSVTTVPLVKVAEQLMPQLIDPTLLVTVPVPVPCGVTVSRKVAGTMLSADGCDVLPL